MLFFVDLGRRTCSVFQLAPFAGLTDSFFAGFAQFRATYALAFALDDLVVVGSWGTLAACCSCDIQRAESKAAGQQFDVGDAPNASREDETVENDFQFVSFYVSYPYSIILEKNSSSLASHIRNLFLYILALAIVDIVDFRGGFICYGFEHEEILRSPLISDECE